MDVTKMIRVLAITLQKKARPESKAKTVEIQKG